MSVLTVGMAVYEDTAGAYFTITGLRANHPRVELIVVDNAPRPDERTRDACIANGGRYVHNPNLSGTAAPRDEVFRLSQTPWTMCVDSHVIFETGAIQAVLDYAAANPDSRDIISGPIIQDNGDAWTHWRRTHPPGLWGVWMDGWFHLATGTAFDALQVGDGVAYDPVMPGRTMPDLPPTRWEERHTVLRAAGCVPAAEAAVPFEIPAMGLGCWAMRTAAWPQFNPMFHSFGGEEGYLHEVVRRRGGKAICLPGLRWRHWFRDGKTAPPYPNHPEQFVWNMLVGHREVGIDATAQIRSHPAAAAMTNEHFASMARGAERCQPWDKPGVRPEPLKVLGIWYSNNAAPPKVLKASLDSIKRAADLSRASVAVATCPWERVEGNPFPEHLADFKDGPGHLNIVRQQKKCLEAMFFAGGAKDPAWREADVVCFLEHDVLYPPDYFDRVARAFLENPDAQVVSNLDYEGLNGTGWLQVKERHEPLHQISMRYSAALANLERAERECEAQGWAYLEPDHGKPREDWVRIPPQGRMPAVHINHDKRLTNHGEVVFQADSRGRTVHPFWGEAADYWPAAIQPTVQVAPGCSSCNKPAAPAVPPPPPFQTIGDWFEDARVRPSDFHEHMATLRDLADQCETVAEVSMWDDKPALVALAASKARNVVSVCPMEKRVWNGVRALRPDGFAPSASDGPVRDGVDLLFLDELHRAQDVFDGLVKYAPHVRRYLVVHCTTAPYGETGDDGGPGVMPGIRRFLNEHREWTAIRHDKGTHGLMVLSRDDRDKHHLPGTLRKALNFSAASVRHLAAGRPMVNERVYEARLSECLTCDQRVLDGCAACGCPIEAKAAWATEECGLVKLGMPPKWAATSDPADLA